MGSTTRGSCALHEKRTARSTVWSGAWPRCARRSAPRHASDEAADVKTKQALPAFVWVEIESSAMEVDRDLEVLRVAEAACGLLHPLDDGVDRLEARVRDAVLQVGQEIGEVALDQLGDADHRLEPAVTGAPEPPREERARCPEVDVVPEGAELFLEHPRPGHLEIASLQFAEGVALHGRHVARPHEPEVL